MSKRGRKRDADLLIDVIVYGECGIGQGCPSVKGKALVDTGATHSFIDSKVVRELDLKPRGNLKIRGIGGKHPHTVREYEAAFSLPASKVKDIPMFEAGVLEHGLLGRTGRVALLGRNALAGGDDKSRALSLHYNGSTHSTHLKPAVRHAVDEEHAKPRRARRKKSDEHVELLGASRTGIAKKKDLVLWEKVKAEAVEQLGGRWSARAAQLATQKYQAAGGRYVGPKPSARENKLAKWTEERWQTRPGTPEKAERDGVMHRYLPEEKWRSLSKAEQLATDRKKVAGSKRGEQYVPNTRAAKVTAR